MIPSRSDNYLFLLENGQGECVVVDPGEYPPIAEVLEARNLTPVAVWFTHHHYDHVEGFEELKQAFPALVTYGNAGDAHRLPPLDVALRNGDIFEFSGHQVRVRHVPGHTLGHMVYHVPSMELAFVGDTLFAMGCGRLFEGEPAMMYTSLQAIAQMPANTRIYCAHEYTADNARFALSLEPNNTALASRYEAVQKARAEGQPTVPTTIEEERATNPYLRCMSMEIRTSLGLHDDSSEIDTFAAIRAAKDVWQG